MPVLCKTVLLMHHKALNLNVPKHYIEFDLDCVDRDKINIYSFSLIRGYRADNSIEKKFIDGTTRFIDKNENDTAIINARSFSPFYASIFWDLTHNLDVGRKLYVYEDSDVECILDTEYYRGAFKLLKAHNNIKVYEKTSSLIIERNRGLSSWTFGIPVGPDEPTVLNKCVSRILELGINDIEIILCGMPHKEFKYFDKVKIVGTDITAPPVHITRKKNEIARFATKDNLCIIHDRVLLPSNFIESMEKFGDMYPLVGFQSIYFSDYANLIPRRYSDFGVLKHNLHGKNSPVIEDKNNLNYHMMEAGAACQHCRRTDLSLQYLTGSLYISKRNLWLYCPQNEEYYWDEFEDIEFGLRTASKGIPSIINPYTFTQSINSRSIIHFFGHVTVKTVYGTTESRRSISEIIPFLRRKPLFRLSEATAKTRMIKFAKKYIPDTNMINRINSKSLDGCKRFRLIFDMVMKSKISELDIQHYVNDYCSLLLHEDMLLVFKERLINMYKKSTHTYDKKILLLKHTFVLNQLSNCFSQQLYMNNADDILVKRRPYHRFNAVIVASFLKYFSKGFYFNLSVREISSIIIDTTPFKVK